MNPRRCDCGFDREFHNSFENQLKELEKKEKPQDEAELRGLVHLECGNDLVGGNVIIVLSALHGDDYPVACTEHQRKWTLPWNGTAILFYLSLWNLCELHLDLEIQPTAELRNLDAAVAAAISPIRLGERLLGKSRCLDISLAASSKDEVNDIIDTAWKHTYSSTIICTLLYRFCTIVDGIRPMSSLAILPDYAIVLKKSSSSDQTLITFRAHRFLLGLRVPYFQTLFTSRFGDANTRSSTFYSDDFTEYAFRIVITFIYRPKELMDLLTHEPRSCGSSAIKESDTLSSLSKYVEIARLATYLQLEDLNSWIHHLILSFVHEFQCTKSGCAKSIPKLMDLVIENPTCIDQKFSDKFLELYAASSFNIRHLWKRQLIVVRNVGILERLQDRIKEMWFEECRLKPLDAYSVYQALAKIKAATRNSPLREDWDHKLLTPLLSHATERIASVFDSFCSVKEIVDDFSDPIGPAYTELIELSETIVKEKMSAKNCKTVWYGLEMLAKGLVDNQQTNDLLMNPSVHETLARLNGECAKWFRKNWLGLSTMHSFSGPKSNRSPEKSFFACWEEDTLSRLSSSINVPIDDLKATEAFKQTTLRSPGYTSVPSTRQATNNPNKKTHQRKVPVGTEMQKALLRGASTTSSGRGNRSGRSSDALRLSLNVNTPSPPLPGPSKGRNTSTLATPPSAASRGTRTANATIPLTLRARPAATPIALTGSTPESPETRSIVASIFNTNLAATSPSNSSSTPRPGGPDEPL